MKAIGVLPEDYGEIYSLNLQKDKRTAIIVNLLAFAIAAVMAVSMNFFVPVTSVFDMSGGIVRFKACRFNCFNGAVYGSP